MFPQNAAADVVALLLANLNSFACDYAARQKAGGTHLRFFVLKQLPVLTPSAFAAPAPWSVTITIASWFLDRVLELTYTAWDLKLFAEDCGWSGPPFRWDEERRFLIRSELDAAFFHLYLPAENNGEWHLAEGETAEDLARLSAIFPTPRDAVSYIMDTFPIVKRKDETKFNGDFRTKRVILEMYDEMAQAVATGQAYQTRLNPPPADPAVAHRPRFDLFPLILPSAQRYSLNDDEAYVMRMILEMVRQGGGRIETELMMKACALLAMPDLLEARGAELVGEVAHEWRQRLCDSLQPSLFMVTMRDLVSRGEINLISHGSAGSTTVRVEGSIRVQDAEIEFDAGIALRVASAVSEAGLDNLPVLATKEEIESLYSAAA
jgi:hypothetical protein